MIPSNIERRIKQHIRGKPHEFYAVYPPGFEEGALCEINDLFPDVQIAGEKGGAAFSGKINDCYAANVSLRGAVRVVMRVAVFRALFFEKLRDKMAALPWELYLDPSRKITFNVSCRRSKLYHSGRIEEECAAAVTVRMQSVYDDYLPEKDPPHELYIRFSDDICTVSIDSSGAPLYMRGYRTLISGAPLRENIAALILREAGIADMDVVIDPMCGSGSFSIEAALSCGAGELVHPDRRFAFEYWPAFSQNGYDFLKRDIYARRKKRKVSIYASDSDDKAVNITAQNAKTLIENENNPVQLFVKNADFFSLRRSDFPGGRALVVMNPPYGKRLGDARETNRFYGEIGNKLEKDFADASFAVIVPGIEAEKSFAMRYDKKIAFMNGGIPVAVLFKK